MHNLLFKQLDEVLLDEAKGHDVIKDQYIKNFNTIWLDKLETESISDFTNINTANSDIEMLRKFIVNKRAQGKDKDITFEHNEHKFYFNRDNCIFHHISGDHESNHITNVLLIKSNSGREAATAVHMLIHIQALLLAALGSDKVDLSELLNLNTELTKKVELWTFETTNKESEAKIDAELSELAKAIDPETEEHLYNDFEKEFEDTIHEIKVNGIDPEDAIIKSRSAQKAKTIANKMYTRLKTAKTYGNKYSLKKWNLNEYLTEFGELLAHAESTQKFLNPFKNESFLVNDNLPKLVEAYYNKLDLSKALENKDECIKLISDNYGYSGSIETGGFYIMPDGTAVKSTNHADIDKFLIRNKYITGKVEDYGDGSQFMDAINCVRIRRRGGKDSWILPYIILPEHQLTQTQYDILTNWVDFVLNSSKELLLNSLDGNSKVFRDSRGDSSYEVISAIKNYYRSGILEQLGESDYEVLFEDYIDDEINTTDYQLEKDKLKGHLDQF